MKKSGEGTQSNRVPKKKHSAKNEPIQIKRHFETMSPKETDDLVDAVAELFVGYMRNHGSPSFPHHEGEMDR